MGLTNAQYDSIRRIYSKRQAEEQHRLAERVDEVYDKCPEIREVSDTIGSLAVRSARALLGGDAETAARLKEERAELRAKKAALLAGAGFPANYLELWYECPDCRDTGYIDGRKCHCFIAREIDILYRQSNIRTILEKENFDHFDLTLFDDSAADPKTGKTQRAYMQELEEVCRGYVKAFASKPGNLLFMGKTGLGKTYLCNCIARELIEDCRSVVYLAAADMFDIFSKDRFSYDSTEEDHSRSDYLMECDLLIIDDLGTELANSFTVSQLFHVINTRLIAGKGTIISTNLAPNEMRDEFTERVMSRIVSEYRIIPMFGEDVRIRKMMRARRENA